MKRIKCEKCNFLADTQGLMLIHYKYNHDNIVNKGEFVICIKDHHFGNYKRGIKYQIGDVDKSSIFVKFNTGGKRFYFINTHNSLDVYFYDIFMDNRKEKLNKKLKKIKSC